MPTSDLGLQLLHTKLHRPVVDVDHIHRSSLLARLNRHRQRPLTLISAPAGYGKSTLASSWLAAGDVPGAWVSLDENDNDPRIFLAYFVAAIHSLFPGSLPKTETLLNAPALPPVSALAQSLINELDEIETAFILVLDDYHAIREKIVHDLLSQLLQYPPAPMHLVISSRYEPPLSIASFRAHRQMTEIRARDLRFSRREIGTYLNQVMTADISSEIVRELEQKTEGWITGIHLAVLSLRQLGEVDQCVSGFKENTHQNAIDRCVSLLPGKSRYIMDYFIAEIFSNQPELIKNMLLRTAILKQFNAQLCDAMYHAGDREKPPAMMGQEFIRWLRRSNLFVIALDNEGQWFRYHHLFQQLLERLLAKEFSPGAIAALHKAASAWHEQHGDVGTAIDHALETGDSKAATQVIERHRHVAINNDKRSLLEIWIAKIPQNHIGKEPGLLIARAWGLLFKGSLGAIPDILDRLDHHQETPVADPSLEGEIDFFKAVLLFWDGQIEDSLGRLQRALQKVDRSHIGARNEIEIYIAITSQMLGQGQAVIREYQQEINNEAQDGPRKANLIGSLVFICLLSGQLAQALKWVNMLLDVGIRTGNAFITAWGEYLLAYVHYQRNDLKVAARHFSRALESRFLLDLNVPIDSFAGFALAQQAMQHPEEADRAIEGMMEFARQSNNISHLSLADVVRAEVLIARGDLEAAEDLLPAAAPATETLFFWIVEPRITQCKLLLSKGSPGEVRHAAKRLDSLFHLARETHNIPRMITLLNLKAAACKKVSADDQALAHLERSLKLGQPGNWIRPFVRPGMEISSLFDRLDRTKFSGPYIDAVMAARDNEKKVIPNRKPSPQPFTRSAASQFNPAAPLTNREIDILDLLKGRLSNQEIADKLYISPETVKRHLYNIYRKLSVKNRREAATKIAALKILS